jgi:zinc/manganese transport system permease protein
MLNAWIVATIVAVVAGVVGFFVVLRGAAFVADAVPQGAFAGAAGASLLGVSTLAGLGVFALAGALLIGWLSRRGRNDVATALTLVMLLGLGALFLSFTTEYAPEIFALLFGEILGVSPGEVVPVAIGAAACVLAVGLIFRPLLLNSLMPELGTARGIRAGRIDLAFLVIVALATSLTLPVVGALLIFSLMTGPPAAARSLTARPLLALAASAGICVVVVWAALAASYTTNWPVGFFVGVLGAACYAAGRGWSSLRGSRAPRAPAPA